VAGSGNKAERYDAVLAPRRVKTMNKDDQFLQLMEKCRQIIMRNLPDNKDDHRRFMLMLKELDGLGRTVRNGLLNTRMYYLGISQMIERNDPEEVIACVSELNRFYCNHYQQL
jgi:hypothetical protein